MVNGDTLVYAAPIRQCTTAMIDTPPDPRLIAWRESIELVHKELRQLVDDRVRMKRFADMVNRNPKLNHSGHPFLFRLRRWYADSTMMTIRRQSDGRSENVHSLAAVLEDMIAAPDMLTRSAIEALYRTDPVARGYLERWPGFIDPF